MKLNEVIDVLNHIGAFEMKHSGRTLGDHLLNTMELLYKHNAPEAVCLAGAFHSVYGTNAYINNAIDYDQRDNYKKVIGDDVEELVYLFSTINRPDCIEEGKLFNFRTGDPIEASEQTIRHLRLMEAANLLEQKCSLLRYPNILREWSGH